MKFITEIKGVRQEFELPDEWYEEQGIHIMWGIEHMAMYKPWSKTWEVKTSRCSQCGGCCQNLNDGLGCEFLLEDKLCAHGPNRPWRCCTSMQQRHISTCTIRYKEVKP